MIRTPDDIARACADSMWRDDHASKGLGMRIEAVGPGSATLNMEVAQSMVNGHGICHGGFIFTLADSAFAFACNTYNQRVVAGQAAITFIAPAHLGDRLTACAREVQRYGRSGLYDITVTRQTGEVVAEFRGQSRTIKGTHLPEDQEWKT